MTNYFSRSMGRNERGSVSIPILIFLTIVVTLVAIEMRGKVQRTGNNPELPKPVAVSHDYAKGDINELLDYPPRSIREYGFVIYTTVKNDGYSGYVTVYTTITNETKGQWYTQSEIVWIAKGTTKRVGNVFSEPELLSFDKWAYITWVEAPDQIKEPPGEYEWLPGKIWSIE